MSQNQPAALRYRVLIAIHMLHFFAPANEPTMRAHLGKPPSAQITPLTMFDCIEYLESKSALNVTGLHEWVFQIKSIAAALEREGFLERYPSPMAMYPAYFAMHQGATAAQARGHLWLAPALGPEFLIRSFGAATIAVTGTLPTSRQHATGTGLLLDTTHILTNAHVVKDMNVDSELLTSSIAMPLSDSDTGVQCTVKVKAQLAHDEIDVALLEIESDDTVADLHTANTRGIAFRDPAWGDDSWGFGYPRVPLARDQTLVVHKGEVVSPRTVDFFGTTFFLFSATSRPGNSGGPIVAQDGRVIGIVTRSLEADDTAEPEPSQEEPSANTSTRKSLANSPFYAGIPTGVIQKALEDLGHPNLLNVERWQSQGA